MQTMASYRHPGGDGWNEIEFFPSFSFLWWCCAIPGRVGDTVLKYHVRTVHLPEQAATCRVEPPRSKPPDPIGWLAVQHPGTVLKYVARYILPSRYLHTYHRPYPDERLSCEHIQWVRYTLSLSNCSAVIEPSYSTFIVAFVWSAKGQDVEDFLQRKLWISTVFRSGPPCYMYSTASTMPIQYVVLLFGWLELTKVVAQYLGLWQLDDRWQQHAGREVRVWICWGLLTICVVMC